jgi:glycosyltransferase involved in cell wall biosynthesis
VTSFSVIVSTYNRPEYLELVLDGYAAQTNRDFEVVVADDGSAPATADTIHRIRKDTGLRITHVWHEDSGFRKSLIVNRAIVAAGGEYLLFTDGDCIPRRDLVEVHRRLARPGFFVAGGYLKLPAPISSAITTSNIRSGEVADLGWLRKRGWKPGRRALRLVKSESLAAFFDAITPTRAEFQGNNASVSREALTMVNGFESHMGYGGLDKALGYRLRNAGVRGIQARHRAITMHLDHPRPYRDDEGLRKNREILDRIRSRRETRALSGLSELAPDPSLRIDCGPA